MHTFEQISQRLLEKSRRYYYPPAANTAEDEELLNNETFAAMLKEIDAFSEQFRAGKAVSETCQAK